MVRDASTTCIQRDSIAPSIHEYGLILEPFPSSFHYVAVPGGTQLSCQELCTQLGIPHTKAEEILTKCCFCRPFTDPIKSVDATFQNQSKVRRSWKVIQYSIQIIGAWKASLESFGAFLCE